LSENSFCAKIEEKNAKIVKKIAKVVKICENYIQKVQTVTVYV